MKEQILDYTNETNLHRLLGELEALDNEQRVQLRNLMDSLPAIQEQDKTDIQLMLDGMEKLTEAERHDITYRLPLMLRNLIAVFEAELNGNVKKPGYHAQRLIIQLANYLGGVQLYIPTNDRLKTTLRNIELFNAYNKGTSVKLLAERYKLSNMAVYAIIKDMLKAQRTQREKLNEKGL